MVTLLAKIFIQEKNDQAKIREEYGVLCGVVGILFNVLLFAGKFLAGTISHSIAITADASAPASIMAMRLSVEATVTAILEASRCFSFGLITNSPST